MPKIVIVLFLILVLLYVFQEQIFPGGDFVSYVQHLADEFRAMLSF